MYTSSLLLLLLSSSTYLEYYCVILSFFLNILYGGLWYFIICLSFFERDFYFKWIVVPLHFFFFYFCPVLSLVFISCTCVLVLVLSLLLIIRLFSQHVNKLLLLIISLLLSSLWIFVFPSFLCLVPMVRIVPFIKPKNRMWKVAIVNRLLSASFSTPQ